MKLHTISGKIAVVLAVILAVSLSCAACSADEGKEETVSNMAQEEQVTGASEEEKQPIETFSPEEAVEETEGQEKESEPEIVEEDTNVYGNSVGNIYNLGIYAEYKDGKYFMRNHEGQVHVIDSITGDSNYLTGLELYEMSYCNGKLYGILSTQNEQLKVANDQIIVVKFDNDEMEYSVEILEEKKPEYMYVVNDMIYYSDSETHKLISIDPETKEEKILVDSEIYYPNVYKDRIIFQNDADGESLYSVPIEGGEITKLNDIRSYWPIVYQDKIYYQGVGDAAYTLRCMKLDGSEDKELAGVEFEKPVICGDKLCFIDISDFTTVSYLDLSNPDTGIQKLDISDELVELLVNNEEVIASGRDMSGCELCEVVNLSYINGCLMFWTIYSDGNGSYFGDNAMYDFEKGMADLLPYYVNTQGYTVN